jgi:DNA-directed RNA polymerase specialized sigma24 family protein
MQHRADFDLASRAARAEPGSFDLLFEQTFACTYAFVARRTPHRAAAERATERILEQVFLELGRYDGRLPFSAWLLAIVKRDPALAAPDSAAPALPLETR